MRRLRLLGAAILVAAGLGGCRDTANTASIPTDATARCPTTAGGVRALRPVDVGRGTMRMVQAGRTLWVANGAAGTLTPIDAATGRAGAPLRGLGAPASLSVDPDGALWIADADGNRVLRVAPGGRTAKTVATIQRPVGIVARRNAVYVMSLDDGLVYVLATPSGARTGIEVGVPVVDPAEMVDLGPDLWVLGAGDRSLTPITLQTGRVVRNGIQLPGRLHTDLTTGHGSVWVAMPGYHSLLRVDPTTLGVQPYAAPRGFAATTAAVDGCTVWSGDTRGRLLRWAATVTPEPRPIGGPIPVGRAIGALVADGTGGVWAADPQAGTVTHVVPARG